MAVRRGNGDGDGALAAGRGGAAGRIARGEVTAVAAVDAHIARIEAVDAKLTR